MSHARDRIVRVLKGLDGSAPSDVVEELMVIVRDTVAEGFDTAADIFEHSPDGFFTPPELLRKYAANARANNHKPAESPTGPWVSGASVNMPPED